MHEPAGLPAGQRRPRARLHAVGAARVGPLAVLGAGAGLLTLLLAGLQLLGAADQPATYAHAPHHARILLPDPVHTPGVVAPETRPVCATRWGRDARHVTETMKVRAYTDYGAVKRKGVCCEIDHLIPRELGGADAQANLWPQPWLQARQKDRVENWLHREVCAGRVPLAEAQRAIATDWYAVYLRMRQATP